MNITVGLHDLFQMVMIVAVVVLVLLVWVWSLYKRTAMLLAFKAGLIAHARAVPSKADQQKLVPQWLERYEELVDSPKKEAYKNRLVEMGVLDIDGNRLKIRED